MASKSAHRREDEWRPRRLDRLRGAISHLRGVDDPAEEARMRRFVRDPKQMPGGIWKKANREALGKAREQVASGRYEAEAGRRADSYPEPALPEVGA